MGNTASKDSHGRTGSPLDFFHTAPTTPSEADLAAMAFSASFAKSQQRDAPPPDPATTSSSSSTTPPPPSAWARKLAAAANSGAPPDWAVISVDDVCGGSFSRLESPALSQGSPWEQSWQERDSGLGAGPEGAGEEVSLMLLSHMERCRASHGGTTSTGAVELLRRLIAERDELVEEVRTLKETLTTERVEWQQFQCDLQVAVSVADRLRVEAEQALGVLQERQAVVEGQLAQALGRQRDTDRELESLQAQHHDACRQLSALVAQQQQQQVTTHGGGDEPMESSQEPAGADSKPLQVMVGDRGEGEFNGNETSVDIGPDAQSAAQWNKAQEQSSASQPAGASTWTGDPETANRAGKLTGKGVAEAYLRTLAALDKRDPKRIVMLSERSWSLSQLQLSVVTPTRNGASHNTSSTLPLCKKEEPVKRRRVDRIFQRQDSWSSSSSKEKQDDDQNIDSFRPKDGFSALLRRHGGSRRNSLLQWCQNRTQGYKNIEITNFSSSWEDGLAFCAMYHTYLPSLIPYSSLNPEAKKENLGLAFQTGETAGITATLSVEEMLKAGGPDWQRVLGYVESIFRHFEM